MGAGGADMEKDCLAIARSFGMRLVGPNCVGTLDLYTGLNTTFINAASPWQCAQFTSAGGGIRPGPLCSSWQAEHEYLYGARALWKSCPMWQRKQAWSTRSISGRAGKACANNAARTKPCTPIFSASWQAAQLFVAANNACAVDNGAGLRNFPRSELQRNTSNTPTVTAVVHSPIRPRFARKLRTGWQGGIR